MVRAHAASLSLYPVARASVQRKRRQIHHPSPTVVKPRPTQTHVGVEGGAVCATEAAAGAVVGTLEEVEEDGRARELDALYCPESCSRREARAFGNVIAVAPGR